MEQIQGKSFDAVILGAGVIGLSIAQELTGKGLKVAIIGRDLPEDLHSSQFASPWAGANWASYAVNEAERKRDTITFRRLHKLSEELPELVTQTPFKYVWNTEGAYGKQWFHDLLNESRLLSPEELPPGYKNGIGFTSYTINTPRYLTHLASTVRSRGVPIVRYRLSSLSEAYALFPDTRLFINALGLGARTLLGVEDPLVHPARGQTVLVRAPNVRTCYGVKDAARMAASGTQTYIIPRPGPEGHVILGGTYVKDEYSTLPDMAVAERILKEAYELCPELGGGRGWRAIEVVSHNVGLRPAREGGMRLELEERVVGQGEEQGLVPRGGRTTRTGRTVGVLHAYGIGPAGYQASLGIAEEVTELATGYLGRQQATTVKAKL